MFVSDNKHVLSESLQSWMLPKHIQRVSDDENAVKKRYNKDVPAEDEWSHITEVGSKIEAADPLNVTERTIFFSKNQATTKQELVQEKAEEFKDQMTNTSQYQKFVNVLLKQKAENLKKMLEKERQFAEELSFFQNAPKAKHDLEKIHSKYIEERDVKTILANLESDYERLKEKYDYEQTLLDSTKKQMDLKRQQIDALQEEMKFINQKQKMQKPTDPVLAIKHELKKMGVTDESGKITEALRTLSKKLNTDDIG